VASSREGGSDYASRIMLGNSADGPTLHITSGDHWAAAPPEVRCDSISSPDPALAGQRGGKG
jgi:hypothetical protein